MDTRTNKKVLVLIFLGILLGGSASAGPIFSRPQPPVLHFDAVCKVLKFSDVKTLSIASQVDSMWHEAAETEMRNTCRKGVASLKNGLNKITVDGNIEKQSALLAQLPLVISSFDNLDGPFASQLTDELVQATQQVNQKFLVRFENDTQSMNTEQKCEWINSAEGSRIFSLLAISAFRNEPVLEKVFETATSCFPNDMLGMTGRFGSLLVLSRILDQQMSLQVKVFRAAVEFELPIFKVSILLGLAPYISQNPELKALFEEELPRMRLRHRIAINDSSFVKKNRWLPALILDQV
ncbi:MAG: hypothetical protein ABIQ95_06680 [Bdellovibrionia bacterium]